jgi:radical SAM protein with 4Fe4S-binding SPASM domain
MAPELFEDILKKIKNTSSRLYFHVMGEPLMHKDISLFLDLCYKYGYKVSLTTNGTLIDRAYPLISKPALKQVNFSVHSQVNNPDEYLDKIFGFIAEARKNRVLTCLRLWNHTGETGNNKLILQKIRKNFSIGFNVEDKPTPINGIKLAEYVFLNQSLQFNWPDIKSAVIGDKGFCYGLRSHIAILVDGTVVPCCLDAEGTINLGNINDKSLDEIFNLKRAQAIFNGFADKKAVEELCKKCGYRTRFNNKVK